MRLNTIKVIMSKVTKTSDCWLWDGYKDKNGYGLVGVNNKVKGVHRAVYEMLVGAVPEGFELDHLCKVRNCVNPKHLEPVTKKENCLRSDSPWAKNARKTHCLNGHIFDELNTYYYGKGRSCRACSSARLLARKDHYNLNRRQARRLKAGIA